MRNLTVKLTALLLSAFVSGSVLADSDTMPPENCLGCHGGSLEQLAENTPLIKNEWDEVVQPHLYIDPSAAKPHESTVLPECLKCHVKHDFPPAPKAEAARADYTYCYGCHHMETFQRCSSSGCHEE